jgi:vancomycin resistance protein YoaR
LASERRYRSRRPLIRLAIIAVALLLAGLLAAGLWLSRAEGDELPPNVSVSGVDVGGETRQDAEVLLVQHSEERLSQEIVFEFPGGEYRVDAEDLGLQPGVDVVLDEAASSRSAFSRLKSRLGIGDEIELTLEYRIEPREIREVANEIADIVNQSMRPGSIRLIDNRIVTEEAQAGIEVDTDALFELLRELPDRVVVPVTELEPSISSAAIASARARAEQLTQRSPVIVFGRERLELSPNAMRRALRFRRAGSEIAVELETQPLARPLRRAFERFERAPSDASFELRGNRVHVVESKDGSRLAVVATVDAILAAGGATEVEAVFRTREPAFSTQKAEELGIRVPVGEFTTEFACCPPRVTNIQRAAQILNGTIIGPGETFSLNDELGQRTEERGFVAAPMIGEGNKLVDSVGGGVSQIATTIFNAAFFSGLDLITHTPHSFYISRYPEGREATVSWGGPELVFRNDWSAAVYVFVGASDNAVTVRFYSSRLARRVETTTGERFDQMPAETVEEENEELEPGEREVIQTGGTPGFTVAYTRKVYRGDELLSDERWTTRYDPANTIVEVGPPEEEEEPTDKGADGGDGTGTDGEGTPSDEDTEGESGADSGDPAPTEPPAEEPSAESAPAEPA